MYKNYIIEREELIVLFDTPWVDVSAGLLAPLLAVFGAYIAWQQWKTNKTVLRQRLFKQRMDVFDFTERLQITANNAKNRYDDLTTVNEIQFVKARVQFLFGEDAIEWFAELQKVVRIEMDVVEETKIAGDLSNKEYVELPKKRVDARKNREAVFSERDAVFSTYLDFSFIRK